MEVRGGTACPAVATWLSTPQYPEVSKGQGRWLCAPGVPMWAIRAGACPVCRQARASQGGPEVPSKASRERNSCQDTDGN